MEHGIYLAACPHLAGNVNHRPLVLVQDRFGRDMALDAGNVGERLHRAVAEHGAEEDGPHLEGLERAKTTLVFTTHDVELAYRFADDASQYRAAVEALGFPCVVKPVMSSSGKGQSVVNGPAEVASAWQYAESQGRVRGGHVIVEVNGVKTCEIKDYKGRMEGHFALQMHAGCVMEVRFKDIEIAE